MCVQGLSEVEVERAALELVERMGAVDIVRWENAPPELRAVVVSYGIPVEDE